MIPKIITGKSVNELNMEAFELLLGSENLTTNRNSKSLGDIYVEYDVNCVLENPRNRHLNLNGRKSNIFALIGETLWVMAGRNDVEFLSVFIPRAKDYSDDGKTWRAAYGERIYHKDQMNGIVDIFKTDGKFTRRAAITIYDPNKDSPKGLKETYNLDSSLDIPCNQWLNFFVDSENKFNLKVIQRSGDSIWGSMSINLTEFSVLHEVVYNSVKELYPEIELGSYNHSITNFHLYQNTASQAEEVLDSFQNHFMYKNEMKIKTPISFSDVRRFFLEITESIEVNDDSIDQIFEEYGVEKNENILYFYSKFSFLYFNLKKEGYKGSNKKLITLDKEMKDFYFSDNEYAKALRDNRFRNFEVSDEV